MIPCIVIGGLFLIFLVLTIIGEETSCCHGEFMEIVAPCAAAILVLFVLGMGFALILTHVQAPEDTANIYSEYQALNYKVEHVDEYNWCDVRDEVNEWNNKLYTMREGKESLWRNWFLPYSIDNVDMIEMPEFSVCPVCGNHKTVVPDK